MLLELWGAFPQVDVVIRRLLIRGRCAAPVLEDIAFFGHLDFRVKVYAPSCFDVLGARTMSVPIGWPKNFSVGVRTVQLLVGEEEYKRILMSS